MKTTKRLFSFGIILVVVVWTGVILFIRHQHSVSIFKDERKQRNFPDMEEVTRQHREAMVVETKRHRENLLANVPEELRAQIIERWERFGAEEFHGRKIHFSPQCFENYPPIFDPENKDEYFARLAGEWLQYTDDRIRDIENWERESRTSYPYYLPQLTESQKERVRNGNPVCDNPDFGLTYHHLSLSPHHAAGVYLFGLHIEELASLRVDVTPNLVALNLTVGDIERWDGSTSLQPVARIVGAHAAGIPWQWRSRYEYHRPDDEIVYMDHAGWLLGVEMIHQDDEKTGWSWFHKRKSYDPDEGSREPPPRPSPKSKPTARFLNYFKFSQTHGAFVNVIEGNRDLMFATRRPSEDELKLAKEKNVELECTPFARDAFVFIVNRHNPVRNLTLQQVRDIFSGKTTAWKDLGGVAGTVHPLVRERNSGSEELMRELVMKDVSVRADFQHQLITSMSGTFNMLETDMEGIGYTILYYDRYMVSNPYTRTLSIDGIEPTPQTVATGSYPLLYECVAVTRKDGPARAKAVVDWLVSEEGQAVVRETGYSAIMMTDKTQALQ